VEVPSFTGLRLKFVCGERTAGESYIAFLAGCVVVPTLDRVAVVVAVVGVFAGQVATVHLAVAELVCTYS
jgi:hypothetical protein